MVVIVWKLDLQLPVQSVPITTKVDNSRVYWCLIPLSTIFQLYRENLNLSFYKVYSKQHYGIKFVSDLQHDIAVILLKVVLNTIIQFNPIYKIVSFEYKRNNRRTGTNKPYIINNYVIIV